jgi:hypothetical protein
VSVLAFSAADAAYVALAIFLIAVGLALAWAFIRLAGTFDRLSSFIGGTEREVLPVINKTGGTVDRVNAELDKVAVATDSAVDAVDSADRAVRAVSFAIRTPIKRLVGLSAGASHGWASLRARRDWRRAMETAKEATARREADFEEELRRVHE